MTSCICNGLGYVAWIFFGRFCWAQCVCRRMAKSSYQECISGKWEVQLRAGAEALG